MTQDDMFLQAIQEAPEDNVPRLQYADWLEEQGDPRGEFLRLVVVLKSMPPDDARINALRRRMRRVRPTIPPNWLESVCQEIAADDVRGAVFRRLMCGGYPRIVHYLRVEDEKDPSWYLLDQLGSASRIVKPYSALKGMQRRSGSRENEDGVVYMVDAVRQIKANKWEVEGGYYLDGLAAVGHTYDVVLKDDQYEVTGASLNWIS